MARQTVGFEWHVIEDDERWNRLPPVEETPARRTHYLTVGEKWFLIRTVRIIVLILVGIVAVTGSPLSPSQLRYQQVQAGIQVALAQEETATPIPASTPSPPPAGGQFADWRAWWTGTEKISAEAGVSLLRIEPLGEQALASVLFNRPAAEWWRSSPYRETRFYEQAATGWVRAAPAPDFWGAQHSLETAHLRFEFTARDLPAVESIAEQIDAHYVALHQMLNLAPPSLYTKLTFVLEPATVHEWDESNNDRLHLASPILSTIPQSLSDETFLTHQMVSLLIERAVDGAVMEAVDAEGRDYSARWQMMIWALNGWLRTDLLGHPSPWHQQAADHFRQQRTDQPPLQLRDLAAWNSRAEGEQARLMGEYAAAESVIAYAVATYGRDFLPTLAHGFGEHRFWSDLIPAIYGVSAETFEAGWNEYLAEHY